MSITLRNLRYQLNYMYSLGVAKNGLLCDYFFRDSYSINNIIFDAMKTFKFKSLCSQLGFQKKQGYSASEIITLMLVLPLMLLKSVNALYQSEFQKVTAMKKDSIYRLKNNEKMPWRPLLFGVAKNSLKSNAILKLMGQNAFVNANAIKSQMACACSNVL